MDFQEQLKQFASRIPSLKGSIQTEEATKMSLIIPVFQMLGYDVFNPVEFRPEYTADVGIKKGEKIDYAIMDGDSPNILIECKSCTENLDKHSSQLFRYFATSTAKFGILTNGLVYRFYTDLDESNKMDLVPFLEIDMENLKDSQISELRKFHKENFDKDNIFSSAEELKYTKLIRDYMQGQFQDPSEDFVRLILDNIYSGVKTKRIVDRYSPLVKKALTSIIAEMVNQKLSSALDTNTQEQESNAEPVLDNDDGIITTEDELKAFYIVQGILTECVAPEHVVYRDVRSYFGILFDDNNRKPICRINLDATKKWIAFPNAEHEFETCYIESVADIYKYKDKLISVVKMYM